ncbi:hypothetical protein FHT40_002946 [Mycolicibacterium sp. BK556]|uniref:hypothetical protein n=1 Tax=unclassified Mycolicibacterium TaxID=2636767 RepID=UPI0016182570|nr:MULTISPECIES: hypothetical protein [unclassified Mycolicibacterium]MBB3603285.1 hypothetical protein [Mycolicibacterium sp. BK556]MBB3633480.1 hypothetical protein [Mycolicibacterium sp. BK607]
MKLFGTPRVPPTDVVVELDTVDELFSVDPRDLLSGAHRIDSGMDELVERFLAQRQVLPEQRIVLNVAGEVPEETAANVVLAVRRYCQLRMRRAIREHNLIWRQGKRALLSGSLLFFIGVALSYEFTRPVMGEVVHGLLGNGVFLVVAWVGLWYPLDLLFIAREQAKREIRVLGNMMDVPVVVRARDRTMPIPVTPHPPLSQALPPSLNARFRRFRGPSKSGI